MFSTPERPAHPRLRERAVRMIGVRVLRVLVGRRSSSVSRSRSARPPAAVAPATINGTGRRMLRSRCSSGSPTRRPADCPSTICRRARPTASRRTPTASSTSRRPKPSTPRSRQRSVRRPTARGYQYVPDVAGATAVMYHVQDRAGPHGRLPAPVDAHDRPHLHGRHHELGRPRDHRRQQGSRTPRQADQRRVPQRPVGNDRHVLRLRRARGARRSSRRGRRNITCPPPCASSSSTARRTSRRRRRRSAAPTRSCSTSRAATACGRSGTTSSATPRSTAPTPRGCRTRPGTGCSRTRRTSRPRSSRRSCGPTSARSSRACTRARTRSRIRSRRTATSSCSARTCGRPRHVQGRLPEPGRHRDARAVDAVHRVRRTGEHGARSAIRRCRPTSRRRSRTRSPRLQGAAPQQLTPANCSNPRFHGTLGLKAREPARPARERARVDTRSTVPGPAVNRATPAPRNNAGDSNGRRSGRTPSRVNRREPENTPCPTTSDDEADRDEHKSTRRGAPSARGSNGAGVVGARSRGGAVGIRRSPRGRAGRVRPPREPAPSRWPAWALAFAVAHSAGYRGFAVACGAGEQLVSRVAAVIKSTISKNLNSIDKVGFRVTFAIIREDACAGGGLRPRVRSTEGTVVKTTWFRRTLIAGTALGVAASTWIAAAPQAHAASDVIAAEGADVTGPVMSSILQGPARSTSNAESARFSAEVTVPGDSFCNSVTYNATGTGTDGSGNPKIVAAPAAQQGVDALNNSVGKTYPGAVRVHGCRVVGRRLYRHRPFVVVEQDAGDPRELRVRRRRGHLGEPEPQRARVPVAAGPARHLELQHQRLEPGRRKPRDRSSAALPFFGSGTRKFFINNVLGISAETAPTGWTPPTSGVIPAGHPGAAPRSRARRRSAPEQHGPR